MSSLNKFELLCLDRQIQIRNLIAARGFQLLCHKGARLVPHKASKKQSMRFLLVREDYKADKIPVVSWVTEKLSLGHLAVISLDVSGNKDLAIITLYHQQHREVIEGMLRDIAPILGLDPSQLNIQFSLHKEWYLELQKTP